MHLEVLRKFYQRSLSKKKIVFFFFCFRGNQQLCALQAVQQFSTRLTELQCALRRDKDTLAVLDAALQAGATTEVASSVRDVARLLSEKQDVCQVSFHKSCKFV